MWKINKVSSWPKDNPYQGFPGKVFLQEDTLRHNNIYYSLDGKIICNIEWYALDSEYYASCYYIYEEWVMANYLRDKDLDVLKLKCLIELKGLGWNIQSIL